MRRTGTLILLALALSASVPRAARQEMIQIERTFDSRVQSLNPDDPFSVMRPTLGLYLENYGAVFTAEVNLLAAQFPMPFGHEYTREQRARFREKKLQRIATLKETMQQTLIDAAGILSSLPPEQSVVFGVSIFRWKWEDTAGLPSQIIMQAPRRALLQAKAGRAEALKGALKVEQIE